MDSVKVGRLPPLLETLSSTTMRQTSTQKGYAHDFDSDHFKYKCSNAPETLCDDFRELPQRSKESMARLSHKSEMDWRLCIARVKDCDGRDKSETQTTLTATTPKTDTAIRYKLRGLGEDLRFCNDSDSRMG